MDIRSDLHPNVKFVLEAHEKLERHDMGAIAETFRPDIVWHEFGPGELSGSYTGISDVMAFWKIYFGAAGASFKQDILEIVANDDYVTSIVRLTGQKTGDSLDQTAIDVMKMAGGKIAEFWRYYADIQRAHAFMAAPE